MPVSLDLEELGDSLRNEDYRNGPEIAADLPRILQHLAETVDTAPMASLRVLVNLCADSDANRDAVSQHTALWKAIDPLLDPSEPSEPPQRVGILLAQFIYADPSQSRVWVQRVYHELPSVVSFVWGVADLDDYAPFVEFLAFFEAQVGGLPRDFGAWGDFVVRCVDGGDPDLLVSASDVLLRVTMVDDEPVPPGLNVRLIEAIDRVPEGDSAAAIQRKLFATSGNLTSMPSYHQEHDFHSVLDLAGGAYAQAAKAITVGNYVTSAARADEVWAQVPSDFVARFFGITITDVVQLQAVHMMTNLVTKAQVSQVLEHIDTIRLWAKIASDNRQYYPEISGLVSKFLRKLIRVGGDDAARELVAVVDDRHTKLALLEQAIAHGGPLDSALVADCFTLEPSETKVELLMEQVKVAGMLVHKAGSSLPQETLPGLESFLTALYEFLPSARDQPVYPAILNNSKFLAAAVASVPGISSTLDSLCLEVVKME
ncbi:hypothetical protein DICA0_B13300 [Diutina catenulata]